MNAIVSFDELYNKQVSRIHVCGEGIVSNILNDDLSGHKHQRFIVRLGEHKTLMILNNIDIFPRLDPLDIGDKVSFSGEYIWNRHGGLVHWTHEDPKGCRKGGYVKIVSESSHLLGNVDKVVSAKYRGEDNKIYNVICQAKHVETGCDLVVYTCSDDDLVIWVCSSASWKGYTRIE
ncbi:MAG: DUF1653 domain-containing protein [Christensenellaceae bacterium]|jgi:hypothetical protein|nr:DUF1653 domain-containing protein [Christensenellaceae bacterium]